MLIVETVNAESVAQRAGIQPGDRLLAYDGKSLPSPAAMLALQENTVGRESVILRLRRQGEGIELVVPLGKLGVETRPELASELLATYQAGRQAFDTKEYAEAARQWSAAAEQAREDSEAGWLWGKVGEAWEKVSEWQEARTAWEAAWARLEESEDTAAQSQAMIGSGRCCEQQSEWDAAEGRYQAARHLDESAGRELWMARAINDLGVVAWQRGDLHAAHAYLTRALQVQERLAPNSLYVASCLNNLGRVTVSQGDLQAAQDYHTRALQIWESLAPDSLNVAISLNNLGGVAHRRGDLQAAQDYHTRALQIRERLAPASMYLASSLGNLGIVTLDRGDLKAAGAYLTRALQVQERLAPNSLNVASSLMNLGNVARGCGDLKAAQDYHTRALHIFERLAPNSLNVAHSLNNLSIVTRDRGDLQVALDYNIRALQIKERLAPNSLDVAISLANLGQGARQRGDLQAALDYHTRALRICDHLAPNSLQTARSLIDLGNVVRDRGDLQSAQDCHTRALQICERLAPSSVDVAHSLSGLGAVAIFRGDLQAAQDHYTRALRIRERLAPNSLDCAASLTQLGRTLLRQHSPDQALPLLKQAVQILEQQRAAIVAPEARALLLAQHTTEFAALIQAHLALGQLVPAFSVLERSRTRSLTELLAERRLDFAAEAPIDLLEQQQQLDTQRSRMYDQLAKLSATSADENAVNTLHRQLGELERKQQELTARIRQASPRYSSLQYPLPLDLRATQARLDTGTLLLSYLVDEEQTFLFAVTRTTLHAFTLSIGVKALQEKVQALRTALDLTDIRNNLPDAAEKGHELYTLLFAPADHQIRRARLLLLCPDGPLHLLPWAALVLKPGRSPRYLGAAKPLHTTLSMTIYAQTMQEARGRGEERGQERAQAQYTESAAPDLDLKSPVARSMRRLLALGDPLYVRSGQPALAATRSADEDHNAAAIQPASGNAQRLTPDSELALLQTRGLTLDPLPHTRTEVDHLAQLFGDQAIVKLGAHATKTAALNESAHADILHFACHGYLDARSPLSSALVLAQPEAMGEQMPEGDNGLLQAWEVLSKMRLDAELVVLSACKTGLGSEVRGEGLIGLTRAFQYAGARSVLLSLWKIADASTSEFMRLFYTQLKGGASKAESLQSAMRAMSRDGKYRHPYYWSAFLLQGDAD